MSLSTILLFASLPSLISAAPAVNPFPGDAWETGYIEVGGENSLFYYLFGCRNKSIAAPPLVIWLEGGPGASSSLGVFSEGGPHIVNNRTGEIERNPYAWNEVADTLFVDQPAGVYFSVAKRKERMCTDEACVTNDFYAFLLKFYEKHPEYKGRELFVSGVSYGGHYVPAIAGRILKEGNKDINLKGIAVGNGLFDLYVQLPAYPEFLYSNGLISAFQYLGFETAILACHLANNMHIKSLDVSCALIFFNLYTHFGITKDRYDVTEDVSIYTVYRMKLLKYLNDKSVQGALGVDMVYNTGNATVLDQMMGDWKYSLIPEVELILKRGLKVFLYFGDNDYVCSGLSGERLVDNLDWSGKEKFAEQEYVDWKMGSIAPARMRRYDNLSLIRVRGAGHTIFFKQRVFALEMLRDLLRQ